MSTLRELIAESKQHEVALVKKNGQKILDLTLFVALIIVFAAPQALLAVLIGVLFDLCELHYDSRPLLNIDSQT
jgi:hypothetical protein